MTTKTMVKAHKKLLKNGKLYDWREHYRMEHNGRTETDTEEHQEFVKHVKIIIDSCMSIRDVLKLKDDNYIVKVTTEDKDITINDRKCDIVILLFSSKKICLECQISKLSSIELYDRTCNYLSSGYEVVWIRKPGVNYQNIYYWLRDDCNGDKSYGKRKEFQLSENIAKLCSKVYKSEISKDYGYVFIKFLKR